MKKVMVGVCLMLVVMFSGCYGDPVIERDLPRNPASIELRGSLGPLQAPADSTLEFGIGVIVRDQQGLTLPDAEVTISTLPPAVSCEQDTSRGIDWFRLVLHVPPDTTTSILEAKSGSVSKRLALILIGE